MAAGPVAVVVGNPKPASRTLQAAVAVAEALTGSRPDHVVDLVRLAGPLVGIGNEADTAELHAALSTVRGSSVAVFASPTFKATYSGLLKLFLDRIPGATGLAGVVSVPVMLGAGPTHALAPDLLLRPVLTELGGVTALPGLYLIDSHAVEEALVPYAERWAPVVAALARPSLV